MTRSPAGCLATFLLLGTLGAPAAHAQPVATTSQDPSLVTLPALTNPAASR